MRSAALKQERDVAELGNSLSALDAQELNLQALEIMADWRVDLTTRIRRGGLKFELIGLDQAEQDKLELEQAEFSRCCKVLKWRGQ